MFNIPLFDRGDGRVAADVGYTKQPVAKTAAYTITQADCGTEFTNRGTSGSVTFTLPAPLPGMQFRFAKIVNNQNIVVTAPTAGTMLGLTAGITVTNSTSEYGTLHLISDGTAWSVVSSTGTWAIS